MSETKNARFDTLLAAMLAGEAPSARKKPSGGEASNAAPCSHFLW